MHFASASEVNQITLAINKLHEYLTASWPTAIVAAHGTVEKSEKTTLYNSTLPNMAKTKPIGNTD